MTSPPLHFLSLPRPDANSGPAAGVPDTTTVAAHDFDVDARTGFMPPQAPLSRLPEHWELWESVLDEAISSRLKLGEAKDITEEDRHKSEAWRDKARLLPVLQTTELKQSEVLLRRAHLVLAWLMHFYINTLHPTAPIIIPRSISIPLLEVSDYMILPPVLTYSDDVLYNWKFKNVETTTGLPTSDNICIQTSFTSTVSEEHFYLVPAYMELRGAVALSLMSLIMDEAYVRDSIALRRISRYLQHLSHVINDLTTILMTMREKCDPDVFYHEVRPWFKGQDSMKGERRWVFEGVGEPEYEHLKQPSDDQLHGPSAGQSSLIHAIDTFLGVESHKASISGASQKGKEKQEESFLGRMQKYMPRHHRVFLRHLATNPRPLRVIVDEETTEGRNPELRIAYNEAVQSLKNLRDFHLRIVAMYIIGPSRRVAAGQREIPGTSQTASVSTTDAPVEKGTGGTNAMVFLKGIRDRTADAVLVSNLDVTTV